MMSEPGGPHDFVYVQTDIPEGMTIHAWREQRAAERQALLAAAREQRRARRRARVIRRWFSALSAAVHRPRVDGREAHA
jgi:hypothetical protein